MKAVTAYSILALIGAGAFAAPLQADLGFRATGGFSYITYGDYNDFAQYANENILPTVGIVERYEKMHWIPEFGGEVFIDFIPTVSVGLGLGVISGKTELSVMDMDLFKHTVKAYPVTLTGYFKPGLPFSMAKPYVLGGVGLYHSKVTFEYPVIIEDIPYMLDAELSKTGFGLHMGAGLEFSVAPFVTIDFCLRGRWADIQGFEGTSTIKGYGQEDVYLYFDDSGGEVYFGVESVSEKDSGREGSVDFSGYAVTVGVSVSF